MNIQAESRKLFEALGGSPHGCLCPTCCEAFSETLLEMPIASREEVLADFLSTFLVRKGPKQLFGEQRQPAPSPIREIRDLAVHFMTDCCDRRLSPTDFARALTGELERITIEKDEELSAGLRGEFLAHVLHMGPYVGHRLRYDIPEEEMEPPPDRSLWSPDFIRLLEVCAESFLSLPFFDSVADAGGVLTSMFDTCRPVERQIIAQCAYLAAGRNERMDGLDRCGTIRTFSNGYEVTDRMTRRFRSLHYLAEMLFSTNAFESALDAGRVWVWLDEQCAGLYERVLLNARILETLCPTTSIRLGELTIAISVMDMEDED